MLPILTAGCAGAGAQQSPTAPYPPGACTSCDAWNVAQAPTRLFGNTYYVGTRGLTALLNSHVHFDHAGGLAALRAASGARGAALAEAVPVLERGSSLPGDPQHGWLLDFPPVGVDDHVADGGLVRVGPLALTAYLTPGHAPGGTTWTWRSCEEERCLDFVYADGHSAVSAPDFRFTDPANTGSVERFEEGQR